MRKYILEILFHLAICHNIIIDEDQTTKQQIFNASSPDELALINFAKFCGVVYLGKDIDNIISIKFDEKIYR